MGWNAWIRQFHRWMSIVFTLAVAANIVLNFIVKGPEKLTLWVGLLTPLPLAPPHADRSLPLRPALSAARRSLVSRR